jgi:hypothetical protein
MILAGKDAYRNNGYRFHCRLNIPYHFKIKTPSNLRCTPLLKRDFQENFLQANTFH